MGKTRPPYPADESLRYWIRQAEINAGEREELRRLRRENRVLQQEPAPLLARLPQSGTVRAGR